jgi:hypothetical protein
MKNTIIKPDLPLADKTTPKMKKLLSQASTVHGSDYLEPATDLRSTLEIVKQLFHMQDRWYFTQKNNKTTS